MKLISYIASIGSVALVCVACNAAPKADVATQPAAAAAVTAPAMSDAPAAMPPAETAAQASPMAGQQALKAQATISEATARQTALGKVPNGIVKASELEEEHALLIWSFDIARPGSNNITEIQVDARTGRIVSNEIETPKDQAKEAAADMQQKP